MKKTTRYFSLLFVVLLLAALPRYKADAAASDYTADAAIAWVKSQVGHSVGYDDGSGYYQCVEFIQAYYQYLGAGTPSGHGCDYAANALPAGWTRTAGGTPQKGDILVYSVYSATVQQFGHVAIYESDTSLYDQDGSVYGATVKNESANYRTYTYNYWGCIHPNFKSGEIRGSEMSSGFDRVLPDGDYLIATAATSNKSSFYYLDILGDSRPAANDTDVALWGAVKEFPPEADIWTITYNSSDKFYTIAQKGTNMCLDVDSANSLIGTNVQVYQSNGSSAQKWAIERNGNNGYRLRAKCSGAGNTPMCLDIANGAIAAGTEVRQWQINDSDAQSWLFIPYQPSQPIEEDRYVLLYTEDQTHEIDLPGNTGDLENETAVLIWADSAQSEYNSFDFIKLSNGYYKVRHAASGLCLGVTSGLSKYKSTVSLYEDNNSIMQQWAILPNGNGYALISQCNGYAFDLPNGNTTNGTQIEVYPRMENAHQRWTFAKAEYTVTYNVNGYTNKIPADTKLYKTDMTLSDTEPTRYGYLFLNWKATVDGQAVTFAPGDVYTADRDITLIAVWQKNYHIISYDANGAEARVDRQAKINGEDINLTIVDPRKAGYIFTGWATSPTAAEAEYQSGALFTRDEDITLYAVWTKPDFIMPETLAVIDESAFEGISASFIVLQDATSTVGKYAFANCPNLRYIYIPDHCSALDYNAFSGVRYLTILGQSDKYRTYAETHGFSFKVKDVSDLFLAEGTAIDYNNTYSGDEFIDYYQIIYNNPETTPGDAFEARMMQAVYLSAIGDNDAAEAVLNGVDRSELDDNRLKRLDTALTNIEKQRA